jgi:sedoheptulose-bisphosphatase
MKTFCKFLEEKGVSEDLKSVLCTLKDSVRVISERIRTAETCKAGTNNEYGEEQMKLDVLADQLIQKECEKNPAIGLLASEEQPDEIKVGEGKFAVAYDPLDGSSLIDVNLAVGTIFAVYKAASFIGVKGDDQEAAMISVYGPRTTIVLALKEGEGVYEFTLGEDGRFCLTNEDVKVGEGKMFAPGNLRACSENLKYLDLVTFWTRSEYTLRYSGGMVPDINHILLKGKGIFSFPAHSKYPEGKLRLLFECAPTALLMEKAGGAATDGWKRILEKEVEKLEQRTPIFIGSKEEVDRCEKYLN